MKGVVDYILKVIWIVCQFMNLQINNITYNLYVPTLTNKNING